MHPEYPVTRYLCGGCDWRSERSDDRAGGRLTEHQDHLADLVSDWLTGREQAAYEQGRAEGAAGVRALADRLADAGTTSVYESAGELAQIIRAALDADPSPVVLAYLDEPNEPCAYGWTDTHMHRCEPHNRPLSHEQDGDDQ